MSCFLTVGDGGVGATEENDAGNNFEFSFRIKNWRMPPRQCEFKTNVAYGFMGHSRKAILERGLNRDGTLVVEVALTFGSADRFTDASWYPSIHQKRQRIRHSSLAERLVRSPEFADIAFCVGPNKVVFRAHKCILAVRARPLLELALLDRDHDETDASGDVPQLRLAHVEEDVFRAFLDYVYTSNEERLRSFLDAGNKNDNKNDPTTALSLLVEADKFGAIDLKMLLERILVDRYLSPSNCCEMLLWADSHWCALLKEAAISVFCSDPDAATAEGNHGWKMLRESTKILSELAIRSAKATDRSKKTTMAGLFRRHHQLCRPTDLAVTELRDWLEDAGLDPDGSREMLIRRVTALDN